MSEDFEAQLQNIQERMTRIAKRQDELNEKRHANALDAFNGNQSASRVIKDIDAEVSTLDAESRNAVAAVAHIHTAQQEAKREIEQRDLERRQHEYKEGVISALAAVTEIDQDLMKLAKDCDQLHGLLTALIRTGVGNEAFLKRMLGRYSLNAAAHYHGVSKHLDVTHVMPAHVQNLSSSFEGLVPRPPAPANKQQHIKPPVADHTNPRAMARYIG